MKGRYDLVSMQQASLKLLGLVIILSFAALVVCVVVSVVSTAYYETANYRAQKDAEAQALKMVIIAEAERKAVLIKGDVDAISGK